MPRLTSFAPVVVGAAVLLAVPGCGGGAGDDADADAVGLLTAGYDPESGRLQLIEYDADENGTVRSKYGFIIFSKLTFKT